MKTSRIVNFLVVAAVLLASLSPARAAGKINVITATQDLAALGAEVGGDRITIEGHTELSFDENVPERFRGYGWNVVEVEDVNDLAALRAAIKTFQETTDRPTLIKVRSVIAYGAPNKHNTHGAHGAPLGEEEIKLTKEAYGWPADQKFLVPDEVMANFRANIGARRLIASTQNY